MANDQTYQCEVIMYSTLNVTRYALRGPKGKVVYVWQGWFDKCPGATRKVLTAVQAAINGECMLEQRKHGKVWVDLTIEEMKQVKAAADDYDQQGRRRR